MNPAFEFELGENARAGHAGDDFLETTHVRRAGGDRLYFPTLLLGIAAVHAEEIAREKSSLVATCPGADFQHGGPSVSGIARQQLQRQRARSEEHTSELQSLMRISYAVFCLKKKKPADTPSHIGITPEINN